MGRRPARSAGLGHARVFVEPEDVAGGRARITGQEFVHLARVLRRRSGDPIELVDGCGRLFRGHLTDLESGTAWAEVEAASAPSGQPAARIGLALPRLSGDLTEQVIRQATELGATEIWIYDAERAGAGPGTPLPERWRRVVRAALVQSGRLVLPELHWLPGAAAVAMASRAESARPFARRWLAEPSGRPVGSAAVVPSPAGLLALVGPAGGLAPAERQTLAAAGFEEVALGPRRLRSETAAVTLLVLALLASGELGPAGRPDLKSY